MTELDKINEAAQAFTIKNSSLNVSRKTVTPSKKP